MLYILMTIPAYAEAARNLGLAAVVFKSPEQLSSDLQALGIRVT